MSLNFVMRRCRCINTKKQENVVVHNNNQYGLYSQLKGEEERGVYLSNKDLAKLLILERRHPEFREMYLEDKSVFILLTNSINEVKK